MCTLYFSSRGGSEHVARWRNASLSFKGQLLTLSFESITLHFILEAIYSLKILVVSYIHAWSIHTDNAFIQSPHLLRKRISHSISMNSTAHQLIKNFRTTTTEKQSENERINENVYGKRRNKKKRKSKLKLFPSSVWFEMSGHTHQIIFNWFRVIVCFVFCASTSVFMFNVYLLSHRINEVKWYLSNPLK